MQNFNSWVCDPKIDLEGLNKFISTKGNIGELYLDKYVIWESSGSSGSPGIFIQDHRALETYDALEFYRKSFADFFQHTFDPFWSNERIAFLGAVDGHFASIISFKRLKKTAPIFQAKLKEISLLNSIDVIVDQLNEFQPTIIATYPSAAILLADCSTNASLKISLKEIWTGGETLTKKMRKYLEETFKIRIHNSYGASEFLQIAWECNAGNLHLNSDWVILEAVDKNYQPIPRGEMSFTTLLTNLANYIQPLIRYDLGDSIRFHLEACSCGSQFPCIDVLGRRESVIEVLGDKGHPVKLLPLALTTVLEEDAEVFDFQICQKNESTLALRLPNYKHHQEKDMKRSIAALNKYLKIQGAGNVKLIEEPNRRITLGRSGKYKRILV